MPMRLLQLLPERLRDISRPRRDFAMAAAGALAVYATSIHLDLAERFIGWAGHYEHLQLDELPFALFAAAAAAAWFSHRRMHDLSIEIGRRRHAETLAKANQQMYKTLFDEGLSGNFVAGHDGRILLHNEAFRSMWGTNADALQLDRILPDSWQGLLERLRVAGKADFAKLELRRADGMPWVVMARFILAQGQQEGATGTIHGYFADITEQYLAEQQRSRLLEENRALALHVLQAREEECRRLAREIHDDMGQYLTAIRLDAAALKFEDDPAANEHARRIAHHAKHMQHAVKNILHDLRPVALDMHGLTDAVSHLVGQWIKQNPGITCRPNLDESCRELPDDIKLVAFRTVQEGLTNVVRHARASEVIIDIRRERGSCLDELLILVGDNGIGFNPRAHCYGFGLTGMRERIESLRGWFRIISGPGDGTLISARLPLPSTLENQKR